MSSRAGADFEAPGAEASTQDDESIGRPATAAEVDYLEARVNDTAEAIAKIKAQIKGLERTLRTTEKLHEDALTARNDGWDRTDVAKRRVK